MYARTLVDVDGQVLTNREGLKINAFMREMDQAFKDKDIRLFRSATTGQVCYRYYCTSEEQKTRFLSDRTYGSPYMGTYYHVYCDEDTNYNSEEYKSAFLD